MAVGQILIPALSVLVICCLEISVDGGSVNKRDVAAKTKLRIVTIGNEPYMTFTQGSNGLKYEGFLADLIYELSRRMNFDYEFYPSPDGRYGALTDQNEWNGMMGELIKRKYSGNSTVANSGEGADMAAAPLTITSQREAVVDFVKPFHNLGLTVLVKKPDVTYSDSFPFDFSIFKPLSASVWGMLVVTFIVVGLMLFALNHFNPYEWGGRYKLGLASEQHRDFFSLPGAYWFTLSTLQWQGYEKAPRSIAGKTLTCFWFTFVTLTLVCYVGGLVNHLWWASMVQRHPPAKHSITDLADLVLGSGKDFDYGCISHGSTYRYITEVAAPKKQEFQLMKQYFESDKGKDSLVKSTEDGIRRVRQGKYAFIMETMTAKWYMNKLPCDLTTIGEQFAMRSYGLAVPRNSPWIEPFHKGILELQEEGELDSMEQKWWDQGECWNYTVMEKTMQKATAMYVNKAEPKRINLAMFMGPLVAMVIGLVLTILVALGEIIYYRYWGRHSESNRPQGERLDKRENEDGAI